MDTTSGNPDTDPYKQVLDQISYLDVQADEQRAQLGPDRFWIVNYEDFCKDPSALVNSIRKRILGVEPLAHPLPPITSNNKVTDEKVFSRICELIKTDVVTGKSTAKDEFATASGDTPSEKPRENLPATSDNTRAASSNKTQPA